MALSTFAAWVRPRAIAAAILTASFCAWILFPFAASASAANAERPLTQMFPMLDRYLRAPAEKRSMFRVRYCTKTIAPKPLAVRYITPDRDVTLRTDSAGCFADLPDLADLRVNPNAVASEPDGAFKVIVALEPALPLKRVMTMTDLRAAIEQADEAARAAAGPLAWGAPHLDSVHFDLQAQDEGHIAINDLGIDLGRDALAGDAVFTDGSRVPLPVRDGRVMVAPNDSAIAQAQWVEFAAEPLSARIGFSTPVQR